MKLLDVKSNTFFNAPRNILDYRKQIREVLEDEYNVGVIENDITSIDAEIIDEIPMIIAQSKGNSNTNKIVEFSNNKVRLSINFDSKLEDNIEQALLELRNTVDCILSIIAGIEGVEFIFSGVCCTLIIEEVNDPMSLLKGSLTKRVAEAMDNKDITDSSTKITFTQDNTHYINIKLSNIHGNLQVENNNSLVKKINCLAIELDINDRFALNEQENYKSSIQSMTKSLDILCDVVNKNIKDIINIKE